MFVCLRESLGESVPSAGVRWYLVALSSGIPYEEKMNRYENMQEMRRCSKEGGKGGAPTKKLLFFCFRNTYNTDFFYSFCLCSCAGRILF